VGAGLTGCEIAYDLAKKGCGVTLVEMLPTVLNVEGLNAANYNMLIDLLEYHKVQIFKNAVVTSYKDGTATIEMKTMNVPNAMGRAATVSLPGLAPRSWRYRQST
jgi:2-enoate reductase